MSRFRFNFGQDDKKKTRRDMDDIVLSNDRRSRYDAYPHEHEEDVSFDRPVSINTHRADDVHMGRSAPRSRTSDQDSYQSPNSHTFKRAHVSREDLQNDYTEQDSFLSMPLRHPQRQEEPGYEQRSFTPNRQQRPQNDVKNLRFWNNEEDEPFYEDAEADTDRPSLVKAIVAVTGLIFIATVAWLTYRWISMPSYDTPPLIEAQTEPYRIRPQTPGGTDFPHQDKLIYDRLAPATAQPVERLLPQPEQAPIMSPTYPHAQGVEPQMRVAETHPQQQQTYYQPAQQQMQPHQAQQQANIPVYRPQHHQGAAPSAQQPDPYYPQQAPVNPRYTPQAVQQYVPNQQSMDEYDAPEQAPQYQPKMAQNPATLMESPQEIATQHPQSQLNAFVNPEPKAQQLEQQSPIAAADANYYFLQLGTLINEDLAKKERDRLQKRYSKELTNINILIKPFIATDGTKKYRLVTKSVIQSRAAALDKCSRLGSICKPVKN
ncbi:MAG: hypothetical protein Q8S21_00565 [Candidatus Paracaedibacteraceae bacterium]|nr:hypothetical protein [Candidatus Paracaedibacteraceae bacterium]